MVTISDDWASAAIRVKCLASSGVGFDSDAAKVGHAVMRRSTRESTGDVQRFGIKRMSRRFFQALLV